MYEPPAKASRGAGGGARAGARGGAAGPSRLAPPPPPAAGWGAPPPPPPPPSSGDALRAADKERRLAVKKRMAELSALLDVLAAQVAAGCPAEPPAGEAAAAAAGAAATAGASVIDPGLSARLEAAKAKRLADIVSKQCLASVKHLMSHKWAWPFNEPVDAQRMGLQDYERVVKQPMDLGTIRARIESGGHYAGPDGVAADVRLVFANARAYNAAGTDVHIMAATLQEAFEGRWANSVAPRQADALAAAAAEAEKATVRSAAAARLARAESAERHLAELGHRLGGAEAQLAEARGGLAALSRPLNQEERRALAAGLRDCAPTALSGAVAVVAAAAGVAEGDVTEIVEVDLETGEPLMLRRLLAYVQAAPKKPAVIERAKARAAAAAAAAAGGEPAGRGAGRGRGAEDGGRGGSKLKRGRVAKPPPAKAGAEAAAAAPPPGFDAETPKAQAGGAAEAAAAMDVPVAEAPAPEAPQPQEPATEAAPAAQAAAPAPEEPVDGPQPMETA